jgi:hypothetical protein
VLTKRCTDFVPPPGESRCPCGRRCRGFRTRWPLSVTVVAVTGSVNAETCAVTAVTCGRDPALDVTSTVSAVVAVAGRHSLSRLDDCPGHLPLATLGSLADETLACGTKVRWSRSLARPLAVASSFQNTPRPKRPRYRAKSCHATTGGRIVP